MDQAYISTLSAFGGTIVGGVTSFVTSWLNQTSQLRSTRFAAERNKREELYGRFMDDLALLYSHALTSETLQYDKLVNAIALRGRIILLATPSVIACANHSLTFLVDLFVGPVRGPAEIRDLIENHSTQAIATFAEACRVELDQMRPR